MMNKDTFIGFVLIGLILIGFSWYNQPSQEQVDAARIQDSIAAVMKENAAKKRQAEEAARKAQAEAAAKGDTTALFHVALNGSNRQVTLKNSKLELTLDTKGGVIKKARVLNFKDRNGQKDVTLFEKDEQSLTFMLSGKNENIVTSDLYFTPSEQTDTTVTAVLENYDYSWADGVMAGPPSRFGYNALPNLPEGAVTYTAMDFSRWGMGMVYSNIAPDNAFVYHGDGFAMPEGLKDWAEGTRRLSRVLTG